MLFQLGAIGSFLGDIGRGALQQVAQAGLQFGRGLLDAELQKVFKTKSKRQLPVGVTQAAVAKPITPPASFVPEMPNLGRQVETIIETVKEVSDVMKGGPMRRRELKKLRGPISKGDPETITKVRFQPMANGRTLFQRSLGECDSSELWAIDPINNCAAPVRMIEGAGRKPLGSARFRLRTDANGGCSLRPVKARRMNALNPKALNRAGRRVSGFVRIAKRMSQNLRKACGPIGKKNR